MRKTLKIALIMLILLIATVAVFSAAVFFKYRSIEKQNILPKIIRSKATPADNVTLGNAILEEYKISCPWNKRPLEADITAGKGSQPVGSPKFLKVKTMWGYTIWKMMFNIQPYLTGKIPEGHAKLRFIPGIDGKTDQLTLNIPSFSSVKISNIKGKLSIAGELKPELQAQAAKSRYYWLMAIFIILILALIYWFFIRNNKKKSKTLKSWALALLNLNELNESFMSGKLSAVKCIANLTDIVRNYLEDRFHIHAPTQTTEEFLKSMENWNSPLDNKDKNFLRDFMVSADMIKFAKYEAPKSQVETAIERAIQLVDETTPNQEEGRAVVRSEQ